MRSCSTVKMPYKNPLFKNLSPYPGGIHQIQVASTLRTLGYPSFWSQVLNFGGLFPHQGNLESKTKFPNPPHQQTGLGLCLGFAGGCVRSRSGEGRGPALPSALCPLPEHNEHMLAGYSQACHSAVVVHVVWQRKAAVSNPPGVMPAGAASPKVVEI